MDNFEDYLSDLKSKVETIPSLLKEYDKVSDMSTLENREEWDNVRLPKMKQLIVSIKSILELGRKHGKYGLQRLINHIMYNNRESEFFSESLKNTLTDYKARGFDVSDAYKLCDL
jgi:type I site-specific restriction endonuclease